MGREEGRWKGGSEVGQKEKKEDSLISLRKAGIRVAEVVDIVKRCL